MEMMSPAELLVLIRLLCVCSCPAAGITVRDIVQQQGRLTEEQAVEVMLQVTRAWAVEVFWCKSSPYGNPF